MRLGIMGGTFDPIHYGHLVTAEEARETFHLDKVIFIPSGKPPHKRKIQISSAQDRCAMVEKATSSNPFFTLSKIEVEREGYSYALDTVNEVLKEYGDDTTIFFITGADAIKQIMSWYKIDELIRKCQFIAATRPGYIHTDYLTLPTLYRTRIHPLDVTALAVSSSQIRELTKHNRSIKYLLPHDVEAYIKEKGLYQDEN